MKLAFTTLGCPGWTLDTIATRAAEMGFEGVDFRGVGEDLDVTVTPAFTSGLQATKRLFADAGVRVSGISTSLQVCNAGKREANLEEAKRTIPTAWELGCDTVRVFGGGTEGPTKEELAAVGKGLMEEVLALDGADALKWVFETHDLWISSDDCKLLLDGIPGPAFGALWDVGHTARVGGESPADSLNALGDRVYAIHVKDAIHDTSHPQAMNDGWRYVSPGEGQLPLAEAVGLLKQRGFDGWAVFEHEKRWHQELPEPEEAFPKYVEWMKQVG